MRVLATSTIAWSVYNWLAVYARGPRTLAEIAAGLAPWVAESRIDVKHSQLGAAVRELERRGYVRAMPGESFDLVDPDRRVLVGRDRTDADGWRGWLVGPMGALRRQPIEQVIR